MTMWSTDSLRSPCSLSRKAEQDDLIAIFPISSPPDHHDAVLLATPHDQQEHREEPASTGTFENASGLFESAKFQSSKSLVLCLHGSSSSQVEDGGIFDDAVIEMGENEIFERLTKRVGLPSSLLLPEEKEEDEMTLEAPLLSVVVPSSMQDQKPETEGERKKPKQERQEIEAPLPSDYDFTVPLTNRRNNDDLAAHHRADAEEAPQPVPAIASSSCSLFGHAALLLPAREQHPHPQVSCPTFFRPWTRESASYYFDAYPRFHRPLAPTRGGIGNLAVTTTTVEGADEVKGAARKKDGSQRVSSSVACSPIPILDHNTSNPATSAFLVARSGVSTSRATRVVTPVHPEDNRANAMLLSSRHQPQQPPNDKTKDFDHSDKHVPLMPSVARNLFSNSDVLEQHMKRDGMPFPTRMVEGRNHEAIEDELSEKNSKRKLGRKKNKPDRRYSEYHALKWTNHYIEAKEFYERFGHGSIPNDYPENRPLGNWARRQRYQYSILQRYGGKGKDSEGDDSDKEDSETAQNLKVLRQRCQLSNTRLELLDNIGFVWDLQSSKWTQSYNVLKSIKEEFGELNHKRVTKSNPKLAIWMKCQRRQYALRRRGKKSSLSEERIRKLNQLGFAWDVKKPTQEKIKEDHV